MFKKIFATLSALPVASIADEVAVKVLGGEIVILSSATGSGKTLFATSKLAQVAGEQIVVCVPRRFLAVNAAETICELSGLTLGNEVGYAVGRQSGEASKMRPNTRLLFVTYGYAISSGLVNRANIIVLDEVHESSMDMSIVRALLRRRVEQGEDVKLMEMSATINSTRQCDYWSGVKASSVFKIDGKTFDCERIGVPLGVGVTLTAEGGSEGVGGEEDSEPLDEESLKILAKKEVSTIANQAINLIGEEDCKGVLVFRPGVGEVEETAKAVKAFAKNRLRRIGRQVRAENEGLDKTELDILVQQTKEASPFFGLEVATIYGEMDYSTRKLAVAAPRGGHAKILIGTNVVESGVNLPWLDAGVTCGTSKQLIVRNSGAVALELVELSKWRLEQQEGRVKRFCNGIFILCSDTSWDERDEETSPEIKRLPLTELVMHCAGFDLRAHELTFDYAPDERMVAEAERKLQKLGLIDGDCKITQAGKWVQGMPVGSETGAMLWHAKQIGVLGAALPLAAVMEAGGVRKDFKYAHRCDSTSDLLDSMKAFTTILNAANYERKSLMEENNVGYKRFSAAKEMLTSLQKCFNGEASSTTKATDDQLRQCILAGGVNQLLSKYGPQLQPAGTCNAYNIGNGSAVTYISGRFAVGKLRTITPRNGNVPFTIVESVTEVSIDDVQEVAKVRPELMLVAVGTDFYTDIFSDRKVSYNRHYFNGLMILETKVFADEPKVVEVDEVATETEGDDDSNVVQPEVNEREQAEVVEVITPHIPVSNERLADLLAAFGK